MRLHEEWPVTDSTERFPLEPAPETSEQRRHIVALLAGTTLAEKLANVRALMGGDGLRSAGKGKERP
jgi:hypothetical protein